MISPLKYQGIVGESTGMLRVFQLVERALDNGAAVALLGESGTGKGLLAHRLHYHSPRRHAPFVVVDCRAIPRELMESEFFGHEQGSATGALPGVPARKIGKFEQADGGTIFLDEIGEMDLDLQAKLLRALQEGGLQRVGGSETITFDARVVSATNQDLRAMVRQGRFRRELYDRLMQYPIELPPLRERGADALHLADHFRERHSWNYPDAERRRFSAAARAFILAYPWPGNVRELKDAVERALATAVRNEIGPSDLRPGELPPRAQGTATPGPTGPGSDGQTPAETARSAASPREILPLEEIKLLAVEHAYNLCGGNINKTSLKLGITRATVYRLLRKRGVEL